MPAPKRWWELDAVRLTDSGTMLGTVAYMSPEQVRATDLGSRTDLFSFGTVLYEMTTGTIPFDGSSPGEICGSILHQDPPPVSQVNPRVPVRLEGIVQKALEKDRNRRYQRAAEMRSDLQRLKRDREMASSETASSNSVTVAPEAPIAQWKISWRILVPVAVCLLVALIAGGLYYRSHRARRLTDKDSIVLADFTNTTGESVFDNTLKQGLAVSLRQSPFLNILSESKVAATLTMMTRLPNTKLTSDLARRESANVRMPRPTSEGRFPRSVKSMSWGCGLRPAKPAMCSPRNRQRLVAKKRCSAHWARQPRSCAKNSASHWPRSRNTTNLWQRRQAHLWTL